MYKKLIILIVMVSCIAAQGGIVSRYSFNTDATDSIGGKNGTLDGTASISGGKLILDGGGSVHLPSDTLDLGLTSVTIEAWYTENEAGNTWTRLFDFGGTDGGGAGGNTMFVVPHQYSATRFVVTTNGFPSWQTGEDVVSGPIFTGQQTHIACVWNGPAAEIKIYLNGVLQEASATTMDLSKIARQNAYIGDSVYDGDPYMTGTVDEFRIHSHAMSDDEVLNSFVTGPGKVSVIGAPEPDAHWKLDEGSGTIASDSVGGNDGTLIGDTAWDTGLYDGALSFDGSGDYVDCGNDPMLNPAGSFSLALWANIRNWGSNWQHSILGKGGDGGRGGYCIRQGNSTALCFTVDGLSGGANFYGNAEPPQNEWVHITCLYDMDGEEVRIYINGVLDAALASGGSVVAKDAHLYLGNRGNSAGDGPEGWGLSYDGLLDEVRYYAYAVSESEISAIMANLVGENESAISPKPRNDAVEVPREVTLSWTPGMYADSHNVYLGTDADEVAAADVNDPNSLTGVSVTEGLASATLDVGALKYGVTYSWRVDEVNELDSTVYPGEVWSFTIEAVGYPIPGSLITVSASSAAVDQGPEKTIDESGLVDGMHSIDGVDSWLSESSDPGTAWIQFDFDKAYKLSQMRIWNYNGPSILTGLGMKDVNIVYSLDGNTWSVLDAVTELASASGMEDYAGELFNIDIGAMSVRITGNSTQGGAMFDQYGLSEVKFYMSPARASNPEPESGTTDLDMGQTLGWKPGRGADEHHVYISTDEQAVIDLSAPVTVVTDPELDVLLSLTNTYYWTVVEVNNNNDPAEWPTDVWNFSSLDYYVIDDFEADDLAWGKSGGGSVELSTDVSHSDDQSLKFDFNNSTQDGYSEARFVYSSSVWSSTNLTKGDPTALVFWVYGDLSNVQTEQMYVRISYSAPGGSWGVEQSAYYKNVVATSELATPWWTQITIPLDSAGVNWTKVMSINIGMMRDSLTSGSGTLYIDDVRLYGTPPVQAAPSNPGTGNLVAYYAMQNDVTDSSGNGLDGTAIGEPNFAAGYSSYGQALSLDGSDDHVELPIGPAISTMTDMTVATWVNWDTTSMWTRIFDFGSGTSDYLFCCPRANSNTLRVALRVAGSGEVTVNAPFQLPSNSWHHVAVVIDATAMTMSLYVDGELVGVNENLTLLPMDMGDTTQNYVGKSQYNDPLFNGSLDEFRIYDSALTPGEVRFLADPTP